jgi:citronellyl-CoA dehydrogenase
MMSLRTALRRASLARRRGVSTAAAAAAAPALSHADLRATIRAFVDREVNPHVDAWEEAGAFPAKELFKKLGAAGLLGINKPPEYGGLGLDLTYAVAAAEELGAIRCGGVPMAIGVQTDMATPALARHGSDELRERFLVPSITGEYVGCIGVSEPGAGSDVAAIRTTARRDGDEFVIDGSKMWITNSTQADWMCLLANTEGGAAPHGNKTLFALPMDLPGITVSPRLDKLGMRSSDTAAVAFDGVRLPASHVIGEVGGGFAMQMQQFQEERLFAAASMLLPLERCIRETAEYAGERRAFGKPVLANQAVRFRLAEMQVEIELLRALVYRAADAHAEGEDVTTLASMAKLKAGRLAREVTDGCLQYWGGMGFMNETLVSRLYRDLRLISIGGGADEVMLEILCKRLGLTAKAR